MPRLFSLEWLRQRKPNAATVESQKTDPFGPGFEQTLERLAQVSRRQRSIRLRREPMKMRRGSGIEFVDHRDYLLGDDPRLIDWNATQRLGHLLLRINEEHEDRSVYVLLDASRSIAERATAKFRLAQRIAAALAYVSLANFDRVLVNAFRDGSIEGEPPGRGVGRILPLMRFLRHLDAAGATFLEASMRRFTARYRRPGVVYVLSDCSDPAGFERALDALRYAKHKIYLLYFTDESDLAPSLLGDVTLVDCETNDVLDVTLTRGLVAELARAAQAKLERLQHYCRTHQVAFQQVESTAAFDTTVLSLLANSETNERRRPKA